MSKGMKKKVFWFLFCYLRVQRWHSDSYYLCDSAMDSLNDCGDQIPWSQAAMAVGHCSIYSSRLNQHKLPASSNQTRCIGCPPEKTPNCCCSPKQYLGLYHCSTILDLWFLLLKSSSCSNRFQESRKAACRVCALAYTNCAQIKGPFHM